MKTRTKRDLEYWFPILLPILIGFTMVTANGVAELLSYISVSSQILDKSEPVAKYGYDNVGGNVNVPRTSNLRIDYHGRANYVRAPIGRDANNITQNGKTYHIISVTQKQQNIPGKVTVTTTVAHSNNQYKNRNHPAGISDVLSVVWRGANEAVIIGIFAAYVHFLVFLRPLIADRAVVGGAYLVTIFGLIIHVCFIIAIPAFHKMESYMEGKILLSIATGLVVLSFLIIFGVREIVWRKYERS